MNNLNLTVVMAVTNEENLEESVSSYLNAKAAFSSVRILMADCIGSEESAQAVNKAVSENPDAVSLLECDNLPARSEVYSKGLSLLSDGYVCFTESAVTLTDNAISFIAQATESYPCSTVEISVKTCNKNGKFIGYSKLDGLSDFCDLNEFPYNAALAIYGYFFKATDVKDLEFDLSIGEEALKKFILEALIKNVNISYSNKAWCESTRALENDSVLFDGQYDKVYYTDSIRKFMIPFMEKLIDEKGSVPSFVQYAFCKLIFAKFANNYYENNKGVLSEEEVYEFYDAVCDALKYIDNTIYTASAIRCKYINRSLWMKILKDKTERAKENHHLELDEEGNIQFAVEGKESAHISTLNSVALIINNINYADGKLELDAEFTGKDFIATEDIELYANFDGKKVKLTEYAIYPLLKCFGMSYSKKYNVHFFIPVTESLEKISFTYVIDGKEEALSLQFAKAFSRIRLRFGKAYWKFNKDKALECKNGVYLRVFKCKGIKRFFREIALMASQLINTKPFSNAVRRVILRSLYWLTRPYFRGKRIWLTFDKLYKGGDNGEYFFKYANTVKDDVQVYYIIDKDSPDCKRLLEYDKKHVLIHNSLKCKLFALNAEAVAATHASVMQYCGIPKYLVPNVLDLFKAKIICIQHGLTVQQLGQYQNRLYDNTTLYCLASKYEKKNLMHPIYGYEESMLKLNGLARYDGLKNNDKKFILITPTWRRNIVTLGIAYKVKPYNEHFKYTEYFRLYNTLINDKKLIECAKKNGYGITYLLHPAMSPQLEDFTQNGFVEIVPAAGDMSYEKILTEASLMVTDYSGVQFDFAYMRKPIVYYHPDTLPPHYESGGIDYPTQGFGPIITNHEDVVNEICKYMENSCKTEPEYIDRANDFFEFDDFNNSKRIYEEIYNSLK
ncbi:MAG: CDP-glycerol glycerophosphotransferase family protein [Ruminococcus sp.]|nr:CDP-glycerol glycerophosphotransferase family protein [Ruminococcus sp.]